MMETIEVDDVTFLLDGTPVLSSMESTTYAITDGDEVIYASASGKSPQEVLEVAERKFGKGLKVQKL